jgi:hypothetical protein
MKKKALGLGILAISVLASVSVTAAGKGILFPDWSKPTMGSYEAPSATLGKMPSSDQPWSQTTLTSSIMGKPLKGKAVSVVGEVIDYSCYLQVGKHGDKHRECGQKCARAGQPVGLLTSDGTIYLLMDEEHDQRRDNLTAFRAAAVEHMGHVVTVNGTASEVEGQRGIYVQGFVK